jgi:heptosyltransferase-2
VSAAGKLLIVGPSWVGDMVMAQALYRRLRARRGPVQIHVIAPPWSLPILERMPEVAAGIELPVAHGELGLAARWSLGRRLRRAGYSQAIVLPRSAKAALVPFFARVPRRTGFRGEWRYGLLNDVRRLTPELDQTVKRFAQLAEERGAPLELPLPAPRLTVDAANRERLLGQLGLPRGPLVALLPGAEYGPAKRWPSASFAELAARLAASGVGVLVLGSAKEHAIGAAVCAGAPGGSVTNLCGATSLADAVDLLSAAAAAVSNDSGLMHVAAAAGTHVVALYGSSSPRFTPPLTQSQTVIYRALDCSPCFARDCPLGHLRCLKDIGVTTVLDAVLTQLAAGQPRLTGGEHAAQEGHAS